MIQSEGRAILQNYLKVSQFAQSNEQTPQNYSSNFLKDQKNQRNFDDDVHFTSKAQRSKQNKNKHLQAKNVGINYNTIPNTAGESSVTQSYKEF